MQCFPVLELFARVPSQFEAPDPRRKFTFLPGRTRGQEGTDPRLPGLWGYSIQSDINIYAFGCSGGLGPPSSIGDRATIRALRERRYGQCAGTDVVLYKEGRLRAPAP